jgi:hypothetical protein
MFTSKIARISTLLALQAIGLTLASLRSEAEPSPLSEELAHCAGIAAPHARLACYDGLARQFSPADAPQLADAPPPVATAPPIAAAPAPSVDAAPANPPAADTARNFGLSPAQINPKPAGPTAIEAQLTGIAFNQGELGQTYLRLDNGEVWKTRDDVARLAVGYQVKIKRAALGSYLLLDPANLSYRVYRVK